MHFLYGICSYVLFGRPFSFSFPAASLVCGTILSSLLVYARASQWFLPYFIWRQEPAVRPPFSTRSPCAIHSGLGQRRSTALPSVWSGHQWGAARLPPVQDENKQEGSRKHWMPKCMRMHEKAKQKMIENDKARRNPNLRLDVFFPHVFPILRLSTSKRKIMQVCQTGSSPERPLWYLWAVTLSDCHGKIGAAQTADSHFLRAQGTWSLECLERLERLEVDPMRPEGASENIICKKLSAHSPWLTVARDHWPLLTTLIFNYNIYALYIYTYVVQYYKTDRQRRRDCSGQLPDVPIRIY